MSFGQRLRQLIRENHMTQRQFAGELSMAPTTLSGYINDLREPDFPTLIRFADYFQVSVDYLIGYSDNPSRAEGAHDQGAEQLLGYYEKLTPETRRLLLDEARLLIKFLR